MLSESDQNGVFQNDYIYFNGQKITWVDLGHGQPTTENYYLTDHLGNTRMIITQFGTVCYDADFYPWGAEQQVYKSTCAVPNYKFTGKERDPDMGEDGFGARLYKETCRGSSRPTGPPAGDVIDAQIKAAILPNASTRNHFREMGRYTARRK